MIMAWSVHPTPLLRAFVLKVRAGNPIYEWKLTVLPGGLEELSNLMYVEEEFLG
jgi:hypothetical protein